MAKLYWNKLLPFDFCSYLYTIHRNAHFRGVGTYVKCVFIYLYTYLIYFCIYLSFNLVQHFFCTLFCSTFVLFNVSLLHHHHHTPIAYSYIRIRLLCSLYAIKHALFILWFFRLVNPRVVRACTIVLTDWEKITARALISAVTILHRISVGCKMPAMLYQVSCVNHV